ncbi:hypothetical protein [Actinoplanes sp. NPDC049118]|uniref:hypothetical protein n=1 Tax=Actinoplanes sp. NPDC049118 TaxID=3155769 RepID=UPI0033FBE68B
MAGWERSLTPFDEPSQHALFPSIAACDHVVYEADAGALVSNSLANFCEEPQMAYATKFVADP